MGILCLLCADDRPAEHIKCTIDDPSQNIEQKLVDCCRWEMFRGILFANLPKQICEFCLNSLESSWRFVEKVERAQHILMGGPLNLTDADLMKTDPLELKEMCSYNRN